MALKPWYKVVTPRDDLREAKPLDAAEFAVHLDKVRDGQAPPDYQDPRRFMARTYLTHNLTALGGEVIRRLSGEQTETSAVFNMTTQFGGGKTHALTMLYHLATHGPETHSWTGVNALLAKAGIAGVPQAATGVFVGSEFDSLTGRGGADGTPVRKTLWGELAFQLGGAAAFAVVAEHDLQMIAPGGDVIRQFLPKDRPSLILMDELMNYVSRNRKSGLANQFYDFLQNLSETIRGEKNAVLVVSIPKSEIIEMTTEDETDYARFKHLLNRLGKPVIMSAESEISEIIRRRLFEWDPQAVGQDGKVLLNKDAIETSNAYADWVLAHRTQVPNWFPVDHARERFAATYPFHPTLLSVFERKWQTLPRFQQTRGILRLLAHWVSNAYHEGYKGAHRDAMIGLGTAPLEDPLFRTAVFEQLGESKLEGAVTTDICGMQESFAMLLDKEAVDDIKKARLHRKVATAILFESNGGVLKAEATIPEIRLAVAEPDMDIGHVDTVLEELTASCYFLAVERNRYRFSISPNLNKILADRRANIEKGKLDERIRAEIQKVFAAGTGVERVFFPEKSNQIPDRPALILVIMAPDPAADLKRVTQLVGTMTKEYGSSGRTFKSALVWCIPDAENAAILREETRKLLAWEAIEDESGDLRLDEGQRDHLQLNLKKAQRDVKEAVWRCYRTLMILGKDGAMRTTDLGLVHSSAADTMLTFILNRLREDGDLTDSVTPNLLTRKWPPAFTEWSTKSVRDAFFASPLFPKILHGEVIKETIARGVGNGILAYVGKHGDAYEPFSYGVELRSQDIEISDDMFIITHERAEAYKNGLTAAPAKPAEEPIHVEVETHKPTETGVPTSPELPETARSESHGIKRMIWQGDIPAQKWMHFYTKVLTRFATDSTLKITMKVEISRTDGIPAHKLDETKVALRELGLPDEFEMD